MLKYIELDGKVPQHSFEEFATSPRNFKDAAILLNSQVVVVDFDDFTDIGQKIYDMYPTLRVHTARGFHLYYKKPKGMLIKNWTKKLTNVGIQVDYKTGKQSLGVVKQNHEMRKMDHEEMMQHINQAKHHFPELPFELWPSKLRELLYGLSEGDGRNSSLFTHLLSLLEMYDGKFDREITHDDLYDLATWINANVFEKPMDKSELSTLTESVQDRADHKPTKYLNKKDMVMTSEVLVEKLDIKYYQNYFYFKHGHRYVSDDNLLLRVIDTYIQLRPAQHKELLKLFEIKAERIQEQNFHIQLRNGYIIDDGDVLEVDAGFTPFYLDVDYNPEMFNEDVDGFFEFLTSGKKDVRNVVEEMLGHTLMTKGFPHVVFFFQGSQGKNGKSTFIKMYKNFIGESTTVVPLDKFDDDTSVSSLIGKLLNVGDDIDASYLDKSSNFKTISAGDPVMIRPIYSPAIELDNKATLMFTCNEMPIFKDKSGGLERRMTVIPCENRVETIDNEIDDKLATDEAKSYLLNLAIAGMARIKANGTKLSDSLTIQAKTQQYFIESDSVAAFVSERGEKIVGTATKRLYRQYVAYCEDEGLNEVGTREFGRRLNTAGYKSRVKKVDGKSERIYEKVTKGTTNES